MKWKTEFGIVILLMLINMACQPTLVKQKPTASDLRTIEENDPFSELRGYWKLAENATAIHDSLGAEFYFSKLFDMIEELNDTYENDSTFLALRDQIYQSYDTYLGIIGEPGSEETAEDVLRDLPVDSEKTGSDTSTVTVPDVINRTHEMRIPLVLNRQVRNAIKYFTKRSRGRRVFSVWLKRASRYEHLIKKILREEGVPEELFFLAMIESGFNPHARSYARAVGIWQFIAATGRAYGLRYNWWFDERRDPVKSTHAAARHLKDLYRRFGDWYLAIAGYNYSPRKIERRLKRYDVNSFWELPRLPRQTRNYIPTFLAAATIAQNPDSFGFRITPEKPLEFDTITVRETVDLNVVAECTGRTFAEIKRLNPALLRWCTPPTEKKWLLYLPKGTREKFIRNYAKIPDNKKFSWVRHRIRFGETLSTIARKYGVSISVIKRYNKIRGTLIRAGRSLVIPVPQNRQYYRRYARSTPRPRHRRIVKRVPGRKKYPYLVKRGDTLWDIARKFGVKISELRYWNGLGYSRIIRPGQTLNIWLPSGQKPSAELLALDVKPKTNGNVSGTQKETRTRKVTHLVRNGDTLWDIAQQYDVSIREIKRWNNMRSNLIHPGDRLVIWLSE